MGNDYAVKFGVFIDAMMTIDSYGIGDGAKSDEDLFRKTTVGQALLKRSLDELGWPNKFQWRQESNRDADVSSIIKECGAYVLTDRKIQGLTDVVLRPFSPIFNDDQGKRVFESLTANVNSRFQSGFGPVERFFGQFVNKFRWFLTCRSETNIEFVKNTIEILLHLWNLEKSLCDLDFETFTTKQKRHPGTSSGYLEFYHVDYRKRFSKDTTQMKKGELFKTLTDLWTYYEVGDKTLKNDRVQFAAKDVQYEFNLNNNDESITACSLFKTTTGTAPSRRYSV